MLFQGLFKPGVFRKLLQLKIHIRLIEDKTEDAVSCALGGHFAETAAKLFLQILLPTEAAAAEKTLELADKLIQNVPAWLLCCDLSDEAVRCSFEGMTGQSFAQKRNGEE